MKLTQAHLDLVAGAHLAEGNVATPRQLKKRVEASVRTLVERGHTVDGINFRSIPKAWRDAPRSVPRAHIAAHLSVGVETLLRGAEAALSVATNHASSTKVIGEGEGLEAGLVKALARGRACSFEYQGISVSVPAGISVGRAMRSWEVARAKAKLAQAESTAARSKESLAKAIALEEHYYGLPAGFTLTNQPVGDKVYLTQEELARLPPGTVLHCQDWQTYIWGADTIPADTKLAVTVKEWMAAGWGNAPETARRNPSHADLPKGYIDLGVANASSEPATVEFQKLIAMARSVGKTVIEKVGGATMVAVPGVTTLAMMKRQYNECNTEDSVRTDANLAEMWRLRLQHVEAGPSRYTETPPLGIELDSTGVLQARSGGSYHYNNNDFAVAFLRPEQLAGLPDGTILYTSEAGRYVVGVDNWKPLVGAGFLEIGFRASRVPPEQLGPPDFVALAKKLAPPDIDQGTYARLLETIVARGHHLTQTEGSQKLLAQLLRDHAGDIDSVVEELPRYGGFMSISTYAENDTELLARVTSQQAECDKNDLATLLTVQVGNEKTFEIMLVPNRTKAQFAANLEAALGRAQPQGERA